MRPRHGARLLEAKVGANLMRPAARARLRPMSVLLHLPLRRAPRLLRLLKVVVKEETKVKAKDRTKVLGKGLDKEQAKGSDKEQAKVVQRRPRQ